MIDKAAIFTNIASRTNIKTDTIDVPEWGGTVRLRGMTAGEKDDFEMSCIDQTEDGQAKSTMRNIRAKTIARCVIDDKGERVFDDDEADALAGEAATVIDPIFTRCQKLNAMSQKDVEELAKN